MERNERISSSQVSAFLTFALETKLGGGCDADTQAGRLLQEQLDAPLPADAYEPQSALPEKRPSIQWMLADPKTPLALILAIKTHAKEQANGVPKEDTPEYIVPLSIYYAAIAAAMIHHGRKITGHEYAALIRSFDKLARRPWMVPYLVDLYEQGTDICRRHVDD